MKFTFNHNNFNVLDLDRSISFYEKALGLKPVREKIADDGSFKLVYLSDGVTGHTLELTWLRDRISSGACRRGHGSCACAP